MAAAKRRLPVTAAAFLLAVCLAVIVAYQLPATYESAATVLIEQQQIPEDLVRSTVNRYADEQLQLLNQIVLTRDTVTELSIKYTLYADEPDMDGEELYRRFREDLTLSTINAAVVNPNSGRESIATIAFTVAFANRSPVIAQSVTEDLANRYVESNVRNRRQLASDTLVFLQTEAERVSARLRKSETELAEFRQANSTRLPEFLTANLQALDRSERELEQVNRDVLTRQNRRILLEANLRELALAGSGTRLAELRQQYLALSATYGPEYPDMRRLRGEIDALGGGTTLTTVETAAMNGQIEELQKQLDDALAVYSSDHPDAVRLTRQIEALRANLAVGSEGSTERASEASIAQTPESIRIETELKSVQAELGFLAERADDLRLKIEEGERRLAQAPAIEREYSALQREYDAALLESRSLDEKLSEARMGQVLEQENQAQRFTLVEPAFLPVDPVAPNRPAILTVGLIFGIALALVLNVVLEGTDGSIRGARDIEILTQRPPIAAIPVIANHADRMARTVRRVGYFGLLAAMVASTLWVLQI